MTVPLRCVHASNIFANRELDATQRKALRQYCEPAYSLVPPPTKGLARETIYTKHTQPAPLTQKAEEVGSVVRSRGCSACCARRVYWYVNYFGVILAIAMARAVVGHRERAVPVACWPSTIYGCSYELSIGLTTSLKTIDGDCW